MVFSGAVAPTERIYSLRRQATGFYRIAHPLLAVVTTVRRTIAPPELRPYLVDVEDDLALAHEDVAAQRDLLSTVLDANLAVISVEQTKVSCALRLARTVQSARETRRAVLRGGALDLWCNYWGSGSLGAAPGLNLGLSQPRSMINHTVSTKPDASAGDGQLLLMKLKIHVDAMAARNASRRSAATSS